MSGIQRRVRVPRFEREHHEISVKIGERRLLPAVREAPEDTLVIADGFSCKTQIQELTDRRALHTAQLIKMAIEHGPGGVGGPRPERHYPDILLDGAGSPKAARVAGMAAAAAALGLGAAYARHH